MICFPSHLRSGEVVDSTKSASSIWQVFTNRIRLDIQAIIFLSCCPLAQGDLCRPASSQSQVRLATMAWAVENTFLTFKEFDEDEYKAGIRSCPAQVESGMFMLKGTPPEDMTTCAGTEVRLTGKAVANPGVAQSLDEGRTREHDHTDSRKDYKEVDTPRETNCSPCATLVRKAVTRFPSAQQIVEVLRVSMWFWGWTSERLFAHVAFLCWGATWLWNHVQPVWFPCVFHVRTLDWCHLKLQMWRIISTPFCHMVAVSLLEYLISFCSGGYVAVSRTAACSELHDFVSIPCPSAFVHTSGIDCP